MTTEAHMKVIREASGSVDSTEDHRLVSFLYELMRDHLPPGIVEGIMMNVMASEPDEVVHFTNGWLAEYAAHMAERLLEKKP